MQLITNRIHTGKVKRFEDFVQEYRDKRDAKIKTASVEGVVKTAEEDEAPSSGQLDVEPLHQTGESTTMPKAGPSAKKEDGDGDQKEVAKVVNEKDEADSSGQPEAEGKLVNNPKVPSKEEKGGEAKGEVKEAGEKGNCGSCGKPNFICRGKCGGDDGEKEEKEEKEEKDVKEARCKKTDKDEEEEKDVKEAQCKKTDKDEEEKEKEKDVKEAQCKKVDEEKKEEKKEEEKEASTKKQFVKIANLDSKNKSFLRVYWTKLFGPEYVNALLADK